MTRDYTPAELMVAAAAREIRDGEVVFVGMRLPLLAFCLARSTHAPAAVGLFENGVVRDSPALGVSRDHVGRSQRDRRRSGAPRCARSWASCRRDG